MPQASIISSPNFFFKRSLECWEQVSSTCSLKCTPKAVGGIKGDTNLWGLNIFYWKYISQIRNIINILRAFKGFKHLQSWFEYTWYCLIVHKITILTLPCPEGENVDVDVVMHGLRIACFSLLKLVRNGNHTFCEGSRKIFYAKFNYETSI